MTKTGKLSNIEKYQIQQHLVGGKTVEEIGTTIDRSPTTVQNYIDGELAQVVESVNRVTVQAEDQRNEDIIRRVYNRFIKVGMVGADVNAMIRSALPSVNLNIEDQAEAEESLYKACLNRRTTGSFMIKKTEGGHEGVAMMTGAASDRSDDARKKPRKTPRHLKGNIFNPKTGQYIG